MKTYCRKEDKEPLCWGLQDPNYVLDLANMSQSDRLKKVIGKASGEKLVLYGDVARFQRNCDEVRDSVQDAPPFSWHWPTAEVPVDYRIKQWYKDNCLYRKEHKRGKGLVIWGDRGSGKSTFVA